jgi:hypothetical protein
MAKLTKEELERILDEVFAKVMGRVPVTYKEDFK